MNTKKILVSCLYLAAISTTHVYAHDALETLRSTSGAGATDVYQVICNFDNALSHNPTDHLQLSIKDNTAAGGQVSATAFIQNRAVTVTDTIPGSTNAGSVERELKVIPAAVEATFLVFVHHTTAANDQYLLSAHCEDSAGNHTGTEELLPTNILQNQ